MAAFTGMKDTVYEIDTSIHMDGGGEAKIYHIDQKTIAKIYGSEYLDKPNSGMTVRDRLKEKIEWMVDHRDEFSGMEFFDRLAWPMDCLYDDDGKFCGLVMPFFKGRTLRELNRYSIKEPGSPKRKYKCAINLSKVIQSIHSTGRVTVSDLHPDNIMYDGYNHIYIVDTDSFTVFTGEEVHPCISFHKDYCVTDDSANSIDYEYCVMRDDYALSIVIYTLLNNGCHPFAAIDAKTDRSEHGAEIVNRNMVDGHYSFSEGYMPYHLNSLRREDFPEEFLRYFDDAFEWGRSHSAKEWERTLKGHQSNFATCGQNNTHLYYAGCRECPYCGALDRVTGVKNDIPKGEETAQEESEDNISTSLNNSISANRTPSPYTAPPVQPQTAATATYTAPSTVPQNRTRHITGKTVPENTRAIICASRIWFKILAVLLSAVACYFAYTNGCLLLFEVSGQTSTVVPNSVLFFTTVLSFLYLSVFFDDMKNSICVLILCWIAFVINAAMNGYITLLTVPLAMSIVLLCQYIRYLSGVEDYGMKKRFSTIVYQTFTDKGSRDNIYVSIITIAMVLIAIINIASIVTSNLLPLCFNCIGIPCGDTLIVNIIGTVVLVVIPIVGYLIALEIWADESQDPVMSFCFVTAMVLPGIIIGGALIAVDSNELLNSGLAEYLAIDILSVALMMAHMWIYLRIIHPSVDLDDRKTVFACFYFYLGVIWLAVSIGLMYDHNIFYENVNGFVSRAFQFNMSDNDLCRATGIILYVIVPILIFFIICIFDIFENSIANWNEWLFSILPIITSCAVVFVSGAFMTDAPSLLFVPVMALIMSLVSYRAEDIIYIGMKINRTL